MINKDLLKIKNENSFSKSTEIVNEYKNKHPEKDLVKLSIGDVSKPIIKEVRDAMKKAVDDLGSMDTFQGYGLYYGLGSLKEKILKHDYQKFGFTTDEIYIGDGTKTDSTSILELFDKDSKILISKLVYPIYKNGALALSRNVTLGDLDNNFKMIVPKDKYDIIYICSPCNPVGNAYTKDELKKFIDYANANNSIILYDNVYRSFIESDDVPDSIYEIEGSKTCAIEFRSFSKDASFTSVRCSYYVIPDDIYDNVNVIWKERTLNRFNGACYIAQKGAEACFEKEAQEMIRENIKYYKDNAHYLRDELIKLGYKVIGGIDAPYLWVKTKDNMDAWQCFMYWLEKYNIVVVPGLVFGDAGKNYIRISALGSKEASIKAIERINKIEKEN